MNASDPDGLRLPVDLPFAEASPPPALFLLDSRKHGHRHAGRVIVLGCALLGRTGRWPEGPRLWASAYLHDLARVDDGHDREHGARAAERLDSLPEVLALFRRAGLGDADLAAVKFAVTHHVGRPEPPMDHPYGPLTALLKDADGLDRVRLEDLDVRLLRYPESPGLVPFAERLLAASRELPSGPGHFEALWLRARDLG
ncbi:MAG: HD domain-containing protein [Planctomycetes bacterium]|jgi:hypothetical protein|nr:HD domain-containing protein [Planctomycetota bacterium]